MCCLKMPSPAWPYPVSQGLQWLGTGNKHHLFLGVAVGISGCSIPWEHSLIKGTQLIKRVLPSFLLQKSQNGWGWRCSGKHLIQSMLRAGSATVGSSEPCPVRFWVSPRVEIPQPLWATCTQCLVCLRAGKSITLETLPKQKLVIVNLFRFSLQLSLFFFFFLKETKIYNYFYKKKPFV